KGLYGMRVQKCVLASGARYSGPTIHFVDEEYDTGRNINCMWEVVAAICEERIKWREDGVPLVQSKDNPDEYY
ncbi:hypothetical protein F2Q70_00021414, partial [Brassica cretica]